jgi:hypothetical protein
MSQVILRIVHDLDNPADLEKIKELAEALISELPGGKTLLATLEGENGSEDILTKDEPVESPTETAPAEPTGTEAAPTGDATEESPAKDPNIIQRIIAALSRHGIDI